LDLTRFLSRFLDGSSEWSAGAGMVSGPGVLDGHHPSLRIIGSTVSPGHGDATLLRVFQSVEQKILSDTTSLDRVALNRQGGGPVRLQAQPSLYRDASQVLAQLSQEGGCIERCNAEFFMSGAQSSQISHILQQ
jgi:hypothetical protein